eukprot:UN31529
MKLPNAKRKLFDDFEAALGELTEFVYEESENVAREDRDREMDNMAKRDPSLDFKVENRKIEIEHYALDMVTVKYYKMDCEVMFSTSPFSMTGKSGNWTYISPNKVEKVKLVDDSKSKHASIKTIDLPKEFQCMNVYVEISGGDILKSKSYFDSDIIVQVKSNFGRLKVVDR